MMPQPTERQTSENMVALGSAAPSPVAAQQARCACPKSTPVRPNSGADPHAPGLGTSQQEVTTVARRRSWRVVLCHGSPLSVVAARLAGGHDGRLTRSPDGPTTLYLDGCGTSGERQHRPYRPSLGAAMRGFSPLSPAATPSSLSAARPWDRHRFWATHWPGRSEQPARRPGRR